MDPLYASAIEDIERNVWYALRKSCCTRCGTERNTMVAKEFGWIPDKFGMKGLICPYCLERLVAPTNVEEHPLWDDSIPWFPGWESMQSQFAGAETVIAHFPPGTPEALMRLPRSDDGWYVEQSDGKGVVMLIHIF